MQKALEKFDLFMAPDKAHYLSILSNTFFGFAFGRMLMTPAAELSGSAFVKILLTLGACVFASYAIHLRKSCRGIIRNCRGRIRPVLREQLLCGILSSAMMVLAVATFVVKLVL